nr:lyase family protein [Frigidibacter sp. ROC022]
MGDPEIARLFTDSAELRAMMLVEGTLALVQGRLGLIPETAGSFLHRAAMEIQIDPAALAEETGRSAVPVPALVETMRKVLQAPDHARYLHWGVTSQDISETGQMLRLRQALAILEGRLVALTKALGRMAADHAEMPMAARTYGQIATPTSFGAVVAGWGAPLLRHLERLEGLRGRLLCVSLSGAAGTLSAMGPEGPKVRAALAAELGLSDPGASWHAGRDRIGELAGWLALVLGSLGKLGEDALTMTQSGIGELRLSLGGGSSTMPQKVNPVLPSVLVALARYGLGLAATLQGGALHRQQRDGAAWITEWLSLPGLLLATGRATSAALELTETARPDPDRMAALLDDGSGLIHAEALSFALAARMPRPEAQAAVKALVAEIAGSSRHLVAEARARWPDLVFPEAAQLGQAPAEARAFARAAAAL